MIWLIILLIVVACIISLNFRLIFLNLPYALYYSPVDLWNYLKKKEYRKAPTGFIDIFTGLFGKGKTLSAVHRVVELYNTYNGKKVWCPKRKKFVTQKIHIISNVELSVPFVKLTSLQQIVETAENMEFYDDKNGTYTVIVALIDEISVQLNSREFKKNINALFLNTMLCCRHYHLGFVGTAQRYNHVDALFRQVTRYVIECDKMWRLQRQYIYDAYELEHSSNVMDVRPLAKTGFFVRNKDFNNYDTLAVVGNLIKSWEEGDMLSDKEILELQCNNSVNIEVEKEKGLFKRRKKRRK